MDVTIYGLVDPRDDKIRYVGATRRDVETRLYDHYRDTKKDSKTPRTRWLAELMSIDTIPEIVILDTVSISECKNAEQRWIKELREDGFNLLNLNPGGDGTAGYIYDDELRQKMSVAHLGQTSWNKGKLMDKAQRLKLVQAWRNPETKEKHMIASKTKKACKYECGYKGTPGQLGAHSRWACQSKGVM